MPSLRQVACALPLLLLPVITVPAPKPFQLVSRGGGSVAAETTYYCFRGTKFPLEWLSWDELLAINMPAISRGNDPKTANNIISAIQSVAISAGILPEFILAMVMQESGGVLVPPGDKGKSFGLMQVQVALKDSINCAPGKCTADDITGMLQQGVFGHTGTGAPVSPGIAYALANENIAAALRVYNSGMVVDANNLQAATPCSTSSYVSDIGNRLLGLSPDEVQKETCGFVSPTCY